MSINDICCFVPTWSVTATISRVDGSVMAANTAKEESLRYSIRQNEIPVKHIYHVGGARGGFLSHSSENSRDRNGGLETRLCTGLTRPCRDGRRYE
jgi:hypothetical protein